jgi:hypothetical protein
MLACKHYFRTARPDCRSATWFQFPATAGRGLLLLPLAHLRVPRDLLRAAAALVSVLVLLRVSVLLMVVSVPRHRTDEKHAYWLLNRQGSISQI